MKDSISPEAISCRGPCSAQFVRCIPGELIDTVVGDPEWVEKHLPQLQLGAAAGLYRIAQHTVAEAVKSGGKLVGSFRLLDALGYGDIGGDFDRFAFSFALRCEIDFVIEKLSSTSLWVMFSCLSSHLWPTGEILLLNDGILKARITPRAY